MIESEGFDVGGCKGLAEIKLVDKKTIEVEFFRYQLHRSSFFNEACQRVQRAFLVFGPNQIDVLLFSKIRANQAQCPQVRERNTVLRKELVNGFTIKEAPNARAMK